MPVAHAGETKYAYLDHDTDVVEEIPPIRNQWYTVFDAEDVRLLWCNIYQYNDESAAKDIDLRWTVDGTVYFGQMTTPDSVEYGVFRSSDPSLGGTRGLTVYPGLMNAGYHVDKRGHSFKVEVRMTTVPGTNQWLSCYCVRETLEQT